MRRLGKRDVERLLADYDRNPVAALTDALRVALDRPDADWVELVEAGFSDASARALLDQNLDALDALVANLNELRDLPDR